MATSFISGTDLIPYRCVLSVTTQAGLPAKFDTLAIVSIFARILQLSK